MSISKLYGKKIKDLRYNIYVIILYQAGKIDDEHKNDHENDNDYYSG